MKVAALYDIHGNLPALEAVLAEVERERFDRIVVGGDAFWGPWPSETLERLRELGDDTIFIRGNCERETLANDPADRWAETNSWILSRLTDADERFVAAWPLLVELEIEGLGTVCFCHATTRSDDGLITPQTPHEVLAATLANTSAALIVCGHTHVQFELTVGDSRLVNAGSVGWGYEGAPGAYWLELGPSARFRRTGYDVEAAAGSLADLGWNGPLEPGDLLSPSGRDEALAVFEARRLATEGS